MKCLKEDSGNTGFFWTKNVKKVGNLLTEAHICVTWSTLMVSIITFDEGECILFLQSWQRYFSAVRLCACLLAFGNFHLFKKLESTGTFFFISQISKVNPHVHLHFLTNGYNQDSTRAMMDQESCLHESM